jgi:2-oxoglutarate dehydrogenase E2 component (dihydrolipoamide succinyltransferase)
MAESISEGTLKQWLKKKGDYVELDEEVATIETDKVSSCGLGHRGTWLLTLRGGPAQIDVAVNAPKAGYITELLAEEEETVAVGQDLFKLEPGAAPEGGE